MVLTLNDWYAVVWGGGGGGGHLDPDVDVIRCPVAVERREGSHRT